MPHLIIEHSRNVWDHVDVRELVDALHDAALSTGLAPVDALRTRAFGSDAYAIADRHPDNAFIAVTLRLGPGRSAADKSALLDALMGGLDTALGDAQRTVMLSVELQEIDPEFRINKNNLRPLVAQRSAEQTEADRNGETDGR